MKAPLTISIVIMEELEKNPRRMTVDDVEILALRWMKDKSYLNNRNVACFIEGFEVARRYLISHFSEMLQEEGLHYMHEYASKRVSDLCKAGVPLTPDHNREMSAAKYVGELLLEASHQINENKVL